MNKITKEEELSINLKLIANSSFIVLIGVIISKILSYIYTVIIARYYGPEIYGIFSLAVIILSWFIAFAGLGLLDGIARYIPIYLGRNQIDKIRYIFQFSLKFLIISGILLSILLLSTADILSNQIFHNENLTYFLIIFSILIPFSILSSIFLSTLRSYEMIKEHSFIFNIFQNVVKVVLIIVFIYFGLKTNAVIYSYSLAIMAMAIISYFFIKIKIPEILKKPNILIGEKNLLKKDLFSYSIPLLFLAITYSVFFWVDSLSIGYLKGAAEVGYYSSAISISLLLLIVPNLFMQLFFPLITKEYSKNNIQLINQLSKQVGKWVFILNIPIFVLLFLFPGTGINILFGEKYLVAENSLRILLFATFFSSISLISMQLLSMIGKSKIILANTIFALILNIILNFIFIPMPKIWFIDNTIGINGAAIATTITFIAFYSLFILQAKHYISIVPLRRKMISIFISAAIPGLIIFYITENIIINKYYIVGLSLIFFLVYALLILLLKGFDNEDIKIIKLVKNKFLNVSVGLNFKLK